MLYLLQPDALEDVKLDAWYMDDSPADQRLPHRCMQPLFQGRHARSVSRVPRLTVRLQEFRSFCWLTPLLLYRQLQREGTRKACLHKFD